MPPRMPAGSWLHIERMGNVRGQWRTPATGSLGPGFPDLMLIKGSRLLFLELKAQRGTMTELQRERLAELREVGADAYCFRPSDFNIILEILHRA